MPEWLKELIETRTVWEGGEVEIDGEEFIAIRIIPENELGGMI